MATKTGTAKLFKSIFDSKRAEVPCKALISLERVANLA